MFPNFPPTNGKFQKIHQFLRIDEIMAMTEFQQSIAPRARRAYLAEFIFTFFFVFAAVGSSMSARKLSPAEIEGPSCLVATAVAQAFALSAAIYMGANISGGHINPAVTFAMAISGHINVVTAVFYWAVQLLGSIMACLVLKVGTQEPVIPTTAMTEYMTGFCGAVVEGAMTFVLVSAVYAAADPRRGHTGVVGPLVVGAVLGANVLASGPFTGGSMNPARSFGPAVVKGDFKNSAVYWVGPLLGAGVASLLYDHLLFPPSPPESAQGNLDTIVI